MLLNLHVWHWDLKFWILVIYYKSNQLKGQCMHYFYLENTLCMDAMLFLSTMHAYALNSYQVLHWNSYFSRCFAQRYCWARWRSNAVELETSCGCLGEYGEPTYINYSQSVLLSDCLTWVIGAGLWLLFVDHYSREIWFAFNLCNHIIV